MKRFNPRIITILESLFWVLSRFITREDDEVSYFPWRFRYPYALLHGEEQGAFLGSQEAIKEVFLDKATFHPEVGSW